MLALAGMGACALRSVKSMALHCPECGEQVLSRRAGLCPGCHRPLPDSLQFTDADKKLMDSENARARRATRTGGSGGTGDTSTGWGFDSCDAGGDCGGD